MLSKRVMRANRDMNKVSKVAKINSCRVCDSKNLVSVLSLGDQFPNDFIADDIELNSDDRVPLDLLICAERNCGLLQLKHSYSRSDLYKNYWFRSSVNETMKKALEDIADDIEKKITLKENNIVLDIGCNDGTLLRSYQANQIQLVGFEPSNLYKEAVSEETNIINDFFSFEAFEKIYSKEKCMVITSIAMFYDLENPNKFVGDIARCMDEQGVWIIQMAYLEPMIQLNGFDNIVHEHLEYYSLFSLTNLLSRHALEVFDVQMNDIYGGSFRVYVKHKDKNIFGQFSSIGGKYGIIESIPLTYRKSLHEGDIFITSHSSDIYPGDIPVAKIIKINDSKTHELNIKVEILVNLDQLRNVFIIK